MSFNFPENNFNVKSSKTGNDYTLACIGNISFSDETTSQITSVCNEPEVYAKVFSGFLNGKPYELEKAQSFISMLTKGWEKKDRFDWLILHEGVVVGTVGIKSLDGEIGYWQSQNHPGVMSQAVQKLCSVAKESGVQSLWAHVDEKNEGSIRVLEKSGFELVKKETLDGESLKRYSINL